MSKHTPEPWHAGEGNGKGNIFAKVGRMRLEQGGTTLYPICHVINFDGEIDANIERIVACVNACKGINPAAVPHLMEACELASNILSLLKDEVIALKFNACKVPGKLRNALALAKEGQ